jgi:hypothetical protein
MGLYEVRILEPIEAQGVGGFGHVQRDKSADRGKARERRRELVAVQGFGRLVGP